MGVLPCWLGLLVGVLAPESGPVTVAVRVAPGPHYVGQGIGVDVTVAGGPTEHEPTLEPPRIPGAELLAVPSSGSPQEADAGPGRTWRFALIPGRAGEVQVGSFRVRVGAERLVASRPTTIKARAVPQVGRTGAFLGGVGPCRVASAAEPTTVRVGRPVECRITLTGPGAWGSIQAPDLSGWSQLGAAFEVRATANVVEPGEPPSRTFRYRLRPMQAGRVVLPPVVVASFDPASGRFQTQATASLPLVVEPPPRFDPGTVAHDPPAAPGRSPLFVWLGWATGVIGIIVGMAYNSNRKHRRRERPISWRREAAGLRRWAGREWPGLDLAEEVDARLSRALGRSAGQPMAVLTPADAIAAARGLTGDEALADRVGRLVATTDRLRFDASARDEATVEDIEALVAEAVAVFEAIGRSVRPFRPDRPSGKRPEPRDQG